MTAIPVTELPRLWMLAALLAAGFAGSLVAAFWGGLRLGLRLSGRLAPPAAPPRLPPRPRSHGPLRYADPFAAALEPPPGREIRIPTME